ncbi:MAG: bifunctional glutamate N-acetyltransferase/amino-acid acetyltransferase ArgJ [Deinococcota bacterium]
MKLPAGFRGAGAAAGIKASGKPDLAMIVSDAPSVWALTATTNRVKAACVVRNQGLEQTRKPIRAVIINSGNANCATGQEGTTRNSQLADLTANNLNLTRDEVVTASTGVIGHQLLLEGIKTTLPNLTNTLEDTSDAAAEAILTTDLVPKQAGVTLSKGASIVGIAKGSGMIHPNMATMLAFVMTDAKVEQDTLRTMWQRVIAQSFNQVTVDGDTSTNDMALALSSGQREANLDELEQGLLSVCQNLAQKIARDGEGATKLISVTVTGAQDDDAARRAARAIVRSPLVKSAAHGNDPNWGRILSAIGQEGVEADFDRVRIVVQAEPLFEGQPLEFDAAHVSAKMQHDPLQIEVDLAAGEGHGQAWGCDLSAEYVRINADYHT